MKILAKKDGACIKRVPKNRWGLQKRVATKWWGWQKSGGKKKVIVSFLIWFATARTFLPAFFFTPTVFLPPLFCHTTSFLHPSFFTATTFLSLLFCYQFFQEKCFWKQRQQQNFFGRWQKRGGRKEVTKKRWCRGEWQKRGGKKEVAKKR